MTDTIIPKKPSRALAKALVLLVIVALLAALIVYKTYVIVEPGHRGIVVQLGEVKPNVLSEGFHIIVPFIQEVVPVEVRVRKSETSQTTSSKDLQVVNTVIAVNYRLEPELVNRLDRKSVV